MQENPRIRIAVLISQKEQLLLVKHRKQGAVYWLLPGGGLEFGETIEHCATRELKEETGLEIRIGDLIYVSESIPPDHHRHVVNLYYDGIITGGELEPGREEVLVSAEWVSILKLSDLDFRPPIAREILDYLNHPDQERPISLGNRWDDN